MTIQQILEIEPSLITVENYVKRKNDEAINNDIYWYNIWSHCKRMQDTLIGDYSRNEQLANSECWNIWHDYLMQLATNCK
jgi:hypothetical protein